MASLLTAEDERRFSALPKKHQGEIANFVNEVNGKRGRWMSLELTLKLLEWNTGKPLEPGQHKPPEAVKKASGATTELLDGQGQQDVAIVRESLKVFANKTDPKESELKANIMLPGNPNLLAGVVIDLPEDEWMRYGGKWIVTQSQHEMKVNGGYTTKLTIKKYKG